LGTLAATEALKEIAGTGDSLAGRLIIYDAKAARLETVSIAWDPENPLSGRSPTIRDLSIHASGLGVPLGTAVEPSPA
jgi:adenylyltransferase/sulfurtransferase